MKRRIILFLFPKRRDRVRCQQCWLLEECAAYLETGVTDYLPDEYPNHRIGRPKRNYPASLYRIFWAGPVAEASERQRHWENIYIGKAPRVRLKAG